MFINASETIGLILAAGTTSITGSMVATLFMILLFLMVIALMFGIPLEFMSILVLPFCIVVAAYYGNFMVPVIIILAFVSMLIAKNWLFK